MQVTSSPEVVEANPTDAATEEPTPDHSGVFSQPNALSQLDSAEVQAESEVDEPEPPIYLESKMCALWPEDVTDRVSEPGVTDLGQNSQLVTFADSFLRSDKTLDQALGHETELLLPSGEYRLELQIWDDDHPNHPLQDSQVEERLAVEFLNAQDEVLAVSNSTEDLPTAHVSLSQVINQKLIIPSGVEKLRIKHPAHPHPNPNSITPSCLLIQPSSADDPDSGGSDNPDLGDGGQDGVVRSNGDGSGDSGEEPPVEAPFDDQNPYASLKFLDTPEPIEDNQTTVQIAGCYFVTKIYHHGVGGELAVIKDGTEFAVSSEYNDIPNYTYLGYYETQEELILKLYPKFKHSPDEVLSTDLDRTKIERLAPDVWRFYFEDWTDDDFNDLVLEVARGENCSQTEIGQPGELAEPQGESLVFSTGETVSAVYFAKDQNNEDPLASEIVGARFLDENGQPEELTYFSQFSGELPIKTLKKCNGSNCLVKGQDGQADSQLSGDYYAWDGLPIWVEVGTPQDKIYTKSLEVVDAYGNKSIVSRGVVRDTVGPAVDGLILSEDTGGRRADFTEFLSNFLRFRLSDIGYDQALAAGLDVSNLGNFELRYSLNGGDFGDWQTANLGENLLNLEFPEIGAGEEFEVILELKDLAGNVSTYTQTIRYEPDSNDYGDNDVYPDPSQPASCYNPVGWYELRNHRTETTKTFWQPKEGVENPGSLEQNSDNYEMVICSYAEKIHYWDISSNWWEDVNNNFMRLESKTPEGYHYRNKANDFQVFFGRTTETGWWYFSNDLDFRVTKVTIGGEEIASSIAEVDHNVITYKDILPGIDLKYVVHSSGVAKNIVINNQEALDQNLGKLNEIKFYIQSNRRMLTPSADEPFIRLEGLENTVVDRPLTFDADGVDVSVEDFVINDSSTELTIFPNQGFLTAGRSFPITIDPGVDTIGRHAAQDSFIRRDTPYAPQGSYNPSFIAVGGRFFDTSVGNNLSTSRGLLAFDGSGVGSAGSVREARLYIREYNSFGGGFKANIVKITGFSEDTVTWNSGVTWYGSSSNHYVNFGTCNIGYSCYEPALRTSSDIRDLVREQVGSGVIRLGLVDSNESANRGVAFCSSESNTWQGSGACNDTHDRPYLKIWINNPPLPPVLESPLETSFIGNCDLSKNPTSLACDRLYTVPFRVSNINDGDHTNLNDPNNKAKLRILGNDYATDPAYRQDVVPYQPASGWWGGIKEFHFGVQNGRYSIAGMNKDEYGAESVTSPATNMVVDNQPPVQVEALEVPDMFNDNQMEFALPQYTDNTLSEMAIALESHPSLVLSTAGRGRDRGTNVYLWENKHVFSQEWTFSGATGEIRGSGGKCLDIDYYRLENRTNVKIWDCTGNDAQKWTYDISNKLLRSREAPEFCLHNDGDFANGGNITIWQCDPGNPRQRFDLQVKDKFRLRLTDTSYTVDASAASNHATVHLWPAHNKDNQTWIFDSQKRLVNGNGYCLNAGKVLSPSTNAATIYDCSGYLPHRQFELTPLGELKHISSGRCLHAMSVSPSAGTDLVFRACNGSANQKFTKETTHFLDDPTSQITYRVQIAKDSNFTDIVYDGWQKSNKFQFACTGDIETERFCIENGITYYTRVQAKDRWYNLGPEEGNNGNISAWSEVQASIGDISLPEVLFMDSSEERISPGNPTSVGIKDSTNVSFFFKEENFAGAELRIIHNVGGENQIVGILDQCRLDGTNNVVPCNSNNLSLPDPEAMYKLHFVWDGKDSGGNFLSDGNYILQVAVSNQAGSTNDLTLAASQVDVAVDDTAPSLNLTSPDEEESWASQSAYQITGSVATFRQDLEDLGLEYKDIAKLELSLNGLTQDITGYLSADRNFLKTINLESGKNLLKITAIDSVGNRSSLDRTLFLDDSAIEILELKPTGLLAEGVQNNEPTIELILASKDSGFNLGNNPEGYYLSLLKQIDGGDRVLQEVYKDQTLNVEFAGGSLSCQENVKGQTVCQLPLKDLEDGKYRIFTQIEDRAGNVICNQNYSQIPGDFACASDQGLTTEFEVRTGSYLEIVEPNADQILAKTTVDFVIKAEKGALLTVQNSQLDRAVEIELGISNSGVLPKESVISTGQLIADQGQASDQRGLAQNPVQISCGEFTDHDTNPDTDDLEICTLSVPLAQLGNQANPDSPQLNSNIIKLKSLAGVELSKNLNLEIDLYQINLQSIPSINLFSPNGDGYYDQITFTNSWTGGEGVNSAQLTVTNYQSRIENSAGDLVWSLDESPVDGNLPGTFLFAGKACFETQTTVPEGSLNQTNCEAAGGYWDWAETGEYTYELSVFTAEGNEFRTKPQTLEAARDLDETIIITSPEDGYLTTRGTINVQGQAPANWQVTICVDTLTTPNNIECDNQKTIQSEASGLFKTIVRLPATAEQHRIWAIAEDGVGNQTGRSNQPVVTVDTPEIFKDVKAIPGFYGVNTQEDIDDFLNGIKTVDDLRTLQLRSTVTPNTEAVDLEFADYTNLDELPFTDPNTGYASIWHGDNVIANINDQTETNPAWNPWADGRIKHDHYPQGGQNIEPEMVCGHVGANPDSPDDDGCLWIFNYPYPFWFEGGLYDIRFKGYKAETTAYKTQGIEVNGFLTSSPRLLRVAKIPPQPPLEGGSESTPGFEGIVAKQVEADFIPIRSRTS